MANDTTSANAIPQRTSGSRLVVADTRTHSLNSPLPRRGTPALVATFAPFPQSRTILETLPERAAEKGYEVCGQVEPLRDGRQVKILGNGATGFIHVRVLAVSDRT